MRCVVGSVRIRKRWKFIQRASEVFVLLCCCAKQYLAQTDVFFEVSNSEIEQIVIGESGLFACSASQ